MVMRGKDMPAFDRYVGIDYSGAQTPTSSLKGLRVFKRKQMSRESFEPVGRSRSHISRHVGSVRLDLEGLFRIEERAVS